jgi:putative ABC transport system permease protein
MLNNYFKIAWRNLIKNRIFSFINVFGLTVGLTSFLLIALYTFDELTFDRFHRNADNIYRLVENQKSSEGKETKIAGAGYQVSERARTDLREIKDAVRLITFSRTNVATAENTNVFYENFTTANEGFLTAFSFPLLQGDRRSALTAPHSVIITEETAKKLFNTTDVLGKVLKVDRDSTPFKITGVLKDFPVNSHLSSNLLFSESSVANEEFKKFANNDWSSNSFTTYLVLDDKADARRVEAKINQLVAANRKDAASTGFFTLQPLKDIHFYSNDIESNFGKKGNITFIYVFAVIALFVLFIACINYMNLTTARFATRSKEIAVRKVTGASRKNLIAQFLSETFLIALIALIFALILVQILLPSFNAFTEKKLTLGIHSDPRILAGIIFIVLIVGLLSGIYPALFQSSLKPFQLFRNKINVGNFSVRRSLVVFQFALSIIMIVATIIVYMQMKYVNTKDMGFKKDQLLVVDINSGKIRRSAETIKAEFEKLPGIQHVSASTRVPGEWKDLPKVKVKSEKTLTGDGQDMYFLGIDPEFLTTYGITLAKGRNFSTGSLGDSSTVILNEMAAKELGITEPLEQIIEIPLDQPFKARVIGIVRDFNFQSLHQPLAPMVLAFQKNPVQNIDYFTAKVTSNDPGALLKQMNGILHKFDQTHLLEYHFLDKQWSLFYQQEQIQQTIFLTIAMLTIIIASLGLFGLATYAAEQRIKEIGIRKVLGASVSSIVTMLSKDFIRLVLVAAVIAFPVAWWAMSRWLGDFAYRINIQWWMFALAGVLAVVIALATTCVQAIKAAVANPVKSLRTE